MKTKSFLCFVLVLSGGLLWGFNTQAAPSEDMQKTVAGNTEFAMNLYARLRTNEGNVFFSPYSISTALAMTFAGAQGETAKQMAQTLHFDLPPDELHPAFAGLETNFEAIQEAGNVQFSIANSLWPQTGYSFLPDFLNVCANDYGAAVNSADYVHNAEAARKQINDWVEDKTHKKIVELLKPGMVDDSTRLVLVDAIYFKGNWRHRFDVGLTQDEPFHITPEKTITAPLMKQMSACGYAEFPDLQVLELPYGEIERSFPYAGFRLSMVVLLPRTVDGLGNLETKLTAENLATWTRLPYQTVHVFLPRFTATSEFSLADTLAGMGMPDAFGANADFSGMDGRHDLYISKVIHKAYVKVVEKGTEAAAATAVKGTYGGEETKPLPIPTFRADHPFIFLIWDNRTGSILFLGRITNPTQE